MPPVIVSPCIDICMIDERSGLCQGCYRSLAEIAAWGSMSAAERQRIMQDLPRRHGPKASAPR